MVWIDNDFPALLGQELYRPDSEYLLKYVVRPKVVHDFSKGAGETVQLDRYKFWEGETGFTKESRERSDTQTIGVNSSRKIAKDKVIITLKEYTGPSDEQDPNQPSTFQIPLRNIITAQRNLWQYGQRAFHDSIGSINLLRDFRKWEDRLYCNELLKSTNTYNPMGVPDGGTYARGPVKFDVVRDLETVVEDLTTRNVPRFEDGNYACVCSPRFLKHLRQDPKFMEVSRYPGAIAVGDLRQPSSPMNPAQIPFVGGANGALSPWASGLMGGQAAKSGAQSMMPTGFVFDGVRFFVSNNLPKAQVNLNYTASDDAKEPTGNAVRDGHLGIFFGPESIGLAVGGPGPEVLLNNNDDFGRFVIAIWRLYGGWELLNKDFVTVARSFGS